ncbi:MAG TPA: peptidyl-prolyl cis-trans isomerase [Sedimentisphaerales bacterium]|nr:peptidyl-prolyl cis-trans isomerase [Sedimentisphaerales bacterium]
MLGKIILQTGLCVLLLVGTRTGAVESAGSKGTADANKAKAAETGLAEKKSAADSNASEVLISLGDEKLTMEQVGWRLPNPDDVQMARLANSWLETELMYAEAERRGITKEPRAAFFADIMRKTAFSQELRRQVADAVKITDEDVAAYYEKNKQTDRMLTTPGKLSFSHIRTETLEEAQTVLEKLKAGEDISALAKKSSVASDAILGGAVKERDYNQIRQLFSEEFLEKLKAAKEGELVGPMLVPGRKGNYEVACKDGETKPTPLPFEQVKENLKSQLELAGKRDAYKSLLDSLVKEAADKTVKSPRLIEAEKAVPEQPQISTRTPFRAAPRPAPKAVRPKKK